MGSKLVQRCTTGLTCVAILVLVAIIVTIWVMLNQGAFKPNHQHQQEQEQLQNQKDHITTGIDHLSSNSNQPSHSKDYIDRSHLDGFDGQVDIVKPLKISPLPLHDHDKMYDQMRNNHETPLLRHHSGHFRHKQAEVWDPHPHYEIDAFGQKLLLELEQNDQFVGPNLHITKSWKNMAHKIKHDPKMSGCFYSGKIKDDEDSVVAVSLCDGMTGIIRTSAGNYYIEPVKKIGSNGDSLSSFPHRIKKISTLPSNDVTEPEPSDGQCETQEDNTIVEDELVEEMVEISPPTHRTKREIVVDYLDTETYTIWPPEIPPRRTTREAKRSFLYDEERKSNEYFIKVLVVADKAMADYHQTDEDLRHYILVLLAHAALLFKDASIGNPISLSVVNLWILKDKEFNTTTSQAMLKEFCDWQNRNSHEVHYDTALLLTRHMMCKNSSSCNMLGVAQMGTICDRSSSCAIVKDIGLPSSYTIAHEIGHVLSAPHDEDKRCYSFHGDIKQKNVMGQMFQNGTKPWIWSGCSRHFITEFLESGKANCLSEAPSHNFITTKFEQTLPGESFEVDYQCELQFGNGSKICTYVYGFTPACEMLWCTPGLDSSFEGCKSILSPWGEGTSCGYRRWCHHGQCIPADRDKLAPIAGGWGPWHGWSKCSRSCGGGIKISRRHCDSPIPENGGPYCIGKSVKYDSCNTEPCPHELVDFRELQCAEHNGDPKNLPNLTTSVQWIPKYGMHDSSKYCQLYCRVKNSNAYYMLKEKVIDGTKCGLTSFDICVNGICRPGGCDNKLDSSMVLDECGVCNGNNSECEEVSGRYNISVYGYNEILRIPKGSSNLDIRQNGINDSNYLALIDGETGKYILNGNYVISNYQKDIIFGNNIIKYTGSSGKVERITTTKNRKLSKDLILQVLSWGKRPGPPDITYRYIVNRDNAPKYGWRLYKKEWSKCSSICSGTQYMSPICVELATSKEQPEHFCSEPKSNQMQRQDCNTHCQLLWNVAQKGPCSANCGQGVRNIYYQCYKIDTTQPSYLMYMNAAGGAAYGEIVDDRHCANLRKLPSFEPCSGSCEATRWEYSDWSECSKTCGGGIQRRSAKCIDNEGRGLDDQHCGEKIVEQVCNMQKCPIWSSREWTPCSTTCGRGFRTKPYYCHVDGRVYNPSACDPKEIHLEKEECMERPCAGWATSLWSECSVTCGQGFQTRSVFCEDLDTHKPVQEEFCATILKPNKTRYCDTHPCEYALPPLPLHRRPNYDEEIEDNSVNFDRRFQWILGDWSQCSKSCNGGTMSRMVICRNDQGEENEYLCDPISRPITTKECNLQPCWNFGDWSDCDSNCEKHRQVSCRTKNGTFVNDDKCDSDTKPPTTIKCKLSECNQRKGYFDQKETNSEIVKERQYRWKTGRWKRCSNTCGKGFRKRNLHCEDVKNDVIVVEQYCSSLPKPKQTKPCERYSCNYTWVEGFWSPCSASCGPGTKTRNVTCHKVDQGGFIDPSPISNKLYHRNYCDFYNKPATTTICRQSNCSDIFVWRTGEWKTCSQQCGKRGRQIRQLYCVSLHTGQRVPKHHCPKEFRPARKRKCNQWRCLQTNCKDVQRSTKSNKNKDYLLSIHGRPAWIYCYKMDTPKPEEYISLSSNLVNFAENYDKRLKNPQTCPFDGQRNESCDCLTVGSGRAGYTEFWKVRLNITTLQILGDVYTFTRGPGMRVPFGTASDCYSAVPGCSQARFSIDLTGTSFKISPRAKWIHSGSAHIDISEHRVQGKCGGYCGNCTPDSSHGLEVEIT